MGRCRSTDRSSAGFIVFEQCDPARPPASDLIESVLVEFDDMMGRRLGGGPSATPDDLSPPGGAYLVGFLADEPVCGGGSRTSVPNYNSNPHAAFWGEKQL